MYNINSIPLKKIGNILYLSLISLYLYLNLNLYLIPIKSCGLCNEFDKHTKKTDKHHEYLFLE